MLLMLLEHLFANTRIWESGNRTKHGWQQHLPSPKSPPTAADFGHCTQTAATMHGDIVNLLLFIAKGCQRMPKDAKGCQRMPKDKSFKCLSLSLMPPELDTGIQRESVCLLQFVCSDVCSAIYNSQPQEEDARDGPDLTSGASKLMH